MIHYVRKFNGNHSAIGFESPNRVAKQEREDGKITIGAREKRLLKLGLEHRTAVRAEKETERRRRFMR